MRQRKPRLLYDAAKMTMIKENSVTTLTVKRIAAFGAFLDAGTNDTNDDILLHNRQQTREVREGEQVEVFIYHDPRHRLTASMRLPKIPMGSIGYVEVIQLTRFGAFVDVGTERGIFLPISETIGTLSKGQHIWIRLYEDKTGRLATSMYVNEIMEQIAKSARGVQRGDAIRGTVYNMTRDGAFLITPEKWIAFLHKTEMNRPVQMGADLTGRITFVRDDGRLNISLRETKEKEMNRDMEILWQALENNHGTLPYTDKSDPNHIKEAFGMSKAAFKRAVGHLYKEGKIAIRENRIEQL
ncbi:MAG: S1-like domain-containing RNA-binding protein [Dialister sp.]|nr:S1-like domain-containing RNA-binding protein [Dialister sp.]